MKTNEFKSATWPWIAALFAATLLAHLTGFRGGFNYDDISEMVNDDAFWNLARPGRVLAALPGRPVAGTSLAIDYALYGRVPFGYHFVNIACHICAALLLFGIVRRTFLLPAMRARWGAYATPLAFSAALIWAVHPLHTEAVTYIIQRCECMMGMFFFLTIYCVVRGSESARATLWNVAAIVSAALGAGCKQTAAMLPFVVLLYDRCFISGSFAGAFRRARWLLAGLCATWLVVYVSLAFSRAKIQSAGYALEGVTAFDYARSQFVVIVHYLRLAFWPVGQCFDYDWRPETQWLRIVPCAALVLALFGATVWRLILNKPSGFWGALFFLTLAPTSSIMPIHDLACERRMYLPLAAIAAMTVMGVFWLAERFAAARAGTITALIFALLAVPLGIATSRRNDLYRDTLELWSDVEVKSPRNFHAWQVVGTGKLERGDLAGARPHLEQALRLNAWDPEALGSMGTLFLIEKKYPEAIEMFRRALTANPKHGESLYGLADALYGMGRDAEGFSELEHAAALLPDNAQILTRYGDRLVQARRFDDARKKYEDALRLNPYNADAHAGLGGVLANTRHFEEALNEFDRSLELNPKNAEAHCNRGFTLEILGRASDAAAAYREALKNNPDFAPAENALAWLLATSASAEIRDGKSAVIHAEKAVALAGENDVRLQTLAAAYAEAGQFDKAIAAAERALKWLAPDAPLAKEIRAQIDLFKAKKPFHVP